MSEKTYRVGEVAKTLNLRTSVLRYWETEFTQLVPSRTEKGQRFYTEEHVTLLRRIQELLYDKGMTIAGARRVLEGDTVPEAHTIPTPLPATHREYTGENGTRHDTVLATLKQELLSLRQLLVEDRPLS